MNELLARELRETYEHAVYEAELDTGTVIFRIGLPPEGVVPSSPLAIVTAWNPARERPGARINEVANARLAAEIKRLGFHASPARGRSEDGRHAEPSFAIAGISRGEARALGRRFRQAAVFYWDGSEASILSCQ